MSALAKNQTKTQPKVVRKTFCDTIKQDSVTVRDTDEHVELLVRNQDNTVVASVDLTLEKAYRLAAHIQEQAERLNFRTNPRKVINQQPTGVKGGQPRLSHINPNAV